MRASHLLLASLLGLGAFGALGCEVPPFEVDPNFNVADSAVTDSTVGDVGSDVVDTSLDEVLAPGTCNSNLDCIGLGPERKCNPTTHKCVECMLSEDCTGAAYCVENVCKPGCKVDNDCIGAKPGQPVGDAGGDARSDGSADAAAATTMKCDTARRICIGCTRDDECNPGYICTASTGDPGDAGATDGGDDATSDVGGADAATSLGGSCVPGCNPSHACQSGLDCCLGKCISTKADLTNCGACGKVCDTLSHTTVKCEDSACKIAACDTGWKDCNTSDADGCETDIFTKVETCGGCGTACSISGGAGKCEGGLCKVASCDSGWADCDGLASNGCEVQLNTLTNCGKCGQACALGNANATCGDGTCKIASCKPGFENCDGITATGCEVNVSNNPNACGTCTNVCPTTGGSPQCSGGVCGYSSCAPGFGSCGTTTDCSTPVTNDINNCGACGRTCTYANASALCSGTTCALGTCNSGFGNCNGLLNDGCERPLDTISDCGGCGTTCTRNNAAATCATGSCKIASCTTNFGDCNGTDSDGCEKNLAADANNCGACNNVCSVPNATAACSASACVVGTCSAGFANCDADPTINGCERALATAFNTCLSPIALTGTSGATTICASKTASATLPVSTYGTRYYKITLNNCMAGGCGTGDMRAKFTLTSPTGMAFDLRLFTTNSTDTCGTAVASSTSGVAGGTEVANWVDTAGACSTTTVYAEVKYRSGTGCGSATLNVNTVY